MVAAVERAVRPKETGNRMVSLGRCIAQDAYKLFAEDWVSQGKKSVFWEPGEAAVIGTIQDDPMRLEGIVLRVYMSAARRGISLESAEGRYLGAWAFYQEVSSLFESASGEEKDLVDKTKQKMEKVIGRFGLEELSLKNGRVFPLDLVKDLVATQRADFPFANCTGTEIIMLCMIVLGKSDNQIAEELSLAKQTVRNKLSELYLELGVRDRTGAAIKLMGHVVE